MRGFPGFYIVLAIMIFLHWYVYQGLKSVFNKSAYRKYIYTTYFTICTLSVASFILLILVDPQFLGKSTRTFLFFMVAGIFFAQFVTAFFLLIDDIRRLFKWSFKKVSRKTKPVVTNAEGMSRSAFFSWIGFIAGGSLFSSLIYGFSNRYDYNIKKEKIAFPNLPSAFKGLKIVQISDIHSGSLQDENAVLRGVQMILDLKPDVILVTGDLVNDRAAEIKPLMHVFSKLKAPFGVYSVLGNHDYGPYAKWPHEGLTQDENLKKLIQYQHEMGWKLLMNEHVVFEKDNQKIALIGVENWSNKRNFPAHGKLDFAHAGLEEVPFKMLMTHDPSHWEGEVISKYNDIDITFSGHTHGMQFGIEIPGFKWSPVQYVYKQWAGLYKNADQYIYVNRGFGFIGYPGRVGILPEITVIELI